MDPNQAQFAATQQPDKSAGNYKFDRTGQQLGSYRLLKLLAGGGFAEVYLGEHVHLNTHAAIKVLQTQLVSEDLELFLAESRIVARLRHPHIVSILDFNVQGNTPFLVMDYAPNGNLRQRHPKHSVVPLATIISYLKQVGDALQYAHNERVIHRDIKPENMLIGGRNEILLSDFGIAIVEHSSRIQMTHDVIGTLAYMPPEQLQGKPRQASDQYALGVVVYEWLGGDCPFHGTIAEIAAQHLHNLPPSLRERNPNIPQAVEVVVFRALAKDPEQRYPKILDFINAFEAASHQQSLRLRDNSVETSSSAAAYAEDFHLTDTVRGGPFEHLAQGPAFSNSEGKARISRRAVLVGLVGLTTLGLAGGGVTWLAEQYIHNQPHKSATKPRSTPTPTATPVTPGRTLFKYLGHSDAVNTVAWSPNPGGTYIASGGKDHSVHVWFASSGTPARSTYGGHSDVVNAVAWSPDGKTIASASADRTVQVWVVFAGSGNTPYTYSGHGDTVNAVVWSPDETTIASGGNDIIVRLWKPGDGGDIRSYSGHGDVVKGLAWSPDGKYIASASADKTVQVWEAATGTLLYAYRGHSDAVNAAAWSPDGQTIASASNDQTAQVWHYADGSNAFSYQGHSDVVNAVAWSSNGATVASASADKTVQEWGGV